MARKGLREVHAKQLLGSIVPEYGDKVALIGPDDDLSTLPQRYPWMSETKLAVKPDQLFGKRGKHGLVGVNLTLDATIDWLRQHQGQEVTVGGVTDVLTHFIVEPSVMHDLEYYVAIRAEADGDSISLCGEGGICIEENWKQVGHLVVPIGEKLDPRRLRARCLEIFGGRHTELVADFVEKLYGLFVRGHFSYFEINPFTVHRNRIVPLDAVVKVDDTAAFEAGELWGGFELPLAFGQRRSPEEAFVEGLDAKTGASLKLTVLNPKGRIWTMVAGGGASVIYADTIADLGWGHELANYGEYSGDPNAELTYQYARTVLSLMTREAAEDGKPKYLFIGGGIANFTDVAKTFTGIIRAIEEYAEALHRVRAQLWVRRGGPNYQQGLENMRALGERLDLPIAVHGPETHMTKIVSMALGGEAQ